MSSEEFSFADEFEALGEELDGKPLPKGDYDMVVSRAEAAITSGGKQCFKVTLEVMSGPEKGKSVFEQLTWSPESAVAARIFAQGLKVMGATQEWIKETHPTPAQIAAEMLGQQVAVAIDIQAYMGEDRNRVRFKRNLGRDGARAQGDTTGAGNLGADEDSYDLNDDTEASAESGTLLGVATPESGESGDEDPWA